MIDVVTLLVFAMLFMGGIIAAGAVWLLEEHFPEMPHRWMLAIVAVLIALIAYSVKHPDAFEILPYLAAIGVPVYAGSFVKQARQMRRDRRATTRLLREQLRRNRE
jgi:hypothetical protein